MSCVLSLAERVSLFKEVGLVILRLSLFNEKLALAIAVPSFNFVLREVA
jgi:hypothetical protein